jgi:hypothetical protein
MELADVNQYAETNGGVYLESPSTTLEVTRPMPYIASPRPQSFTSSSDTSPCFRA